MQINGTSAIGIGFLQVKLMINFLVCTFHTRYSLRLFHTIRLIHRTACVSKEEKFDTKGFGGYE